MSMMISPEGMTLLSAGAVGVSAGLIVVGAVGVKIISFCRNGKSPKNGDKQEVYVGPERRTSCMLTATDRDELGKTTERSKRIESCIQTILNNQVVTSQHLLEISLTFKNHITDDQRSNEVLKDSLKRIEDSQDNMESKLRTK